LKLIEGLRLPRVPPQGGRKIAAEFLQVDTRNICLSVVVPSPAGKGHP